MKFRITLALSLGWIMTFSQQNPLMSSFAEYQDAKNSTHFHLQAMSIGPGLNSARLDAVQIHPSAPQTIYAAFGSGNVWKSSNNGMQWKPIFENQASQGIGDIAIAPSDPNILYIGTGESLKKPRNFTFPGTGVYKSIDAGENWQHVGLEQSWHIGEIAIHPSNPNIVVVAVLGHFWSNNPERGLYRTEDGGENWEQVLYVDDNTGANDVVISPSNPNIMYASMWQHAPDLSGPQSGIYKSTDAGKSWVQLKNGLPTTPKIGRIGLAVSYQNPNKVYALIDNLSKPRNHAAEVYSSEDGGVQWIKTHQEELLIFPGIGWYFADIFVDPQDDSSIYALGVGLAHSQNNGKDFSLIRGEVQHLKKSIAQTLHLDHCELWINPLNPQHLALGNDGGLYLSYDQGKNWLHLNNIPVGEFYDITVDQSTPYRIFGGVQDNATVYGPARPYRPHLGEEWQYLWIDAWSGGDGCVTQVDPEDPNTVYFSLQNRSIRKKNLAQNTSVGIRPGFQEREKDKTLAYNFIAPYFLSKHNHRTLYHGGNYIFKTTDQGNNWDCISPDLSRSAFKEKESLACGAIAESPLSAGVLYAGTDKGAFWYSRDDGKNWKEHSEGLANAYIRSICPSNHQKDRVYLAQSGLNYDDFDNHLFVSEDNGENWTSIQGNLPNETANVILEDPFDPDILYAGLLRGVYISLDKGKNWSLLCPNMPAVSIADLEIQLVAKDLIIGTHGRGIYQLNLNPIYEAKAKNQELGSLYLFGLPKVYAPIKVDTHQDIKRTSLEPFPISFWLEKSGEVQIKVKKEKELIWEKEINASKGLNQYLWDLETAHTESDFPYFIHFKKYLSKGNYTLELSMNGASVEKMLEVN